MSKKNSRIGSSLDDFLREEGIYEEATARAVKSVIAWELEQAMKEQKINKTTMAKRMGKSRAQLDRVLDPDNASLTLKSLIIAAQSVDKRLQIKLVDA